MLLSVQQDLNFTFVSFAPWPNAQPGFAIHTQIVALIQRVHDVGEPVSFTFDPRPEVVENITNGIDADFIDAWQHMITSSTTTASPT